MAPNARKARQEVDRQKSTGDTNFVKSMLYFFELRVDEKFNFRGATQFIFPLVVGLDSLSMEEPFTVEKTVTQGGGLYVEENGIVMRTIRLKGNTGFKPRRLASPRGGSKIAQGPNSLGVLSPEKRSFGRVLPTHVLREISGQRHFQYLQDSVFRIYGDLKNDAEKSEGTRLFFHNPKDQEAWLVIPEKFSLARAASKRVLYEYDIELTAVAKSDLENVSFISEDQEMLDKVKDKIRVAKSFVDSATSTIEDLTATLNEITRTVSSAGSVVDDVNHLIGATTDFIEGGANLAKGVVGSVIDVIKAPAELVRNLSEQIDAVTGIIVNVVSEVKSIPSTYINTWRELGQAVERMGMVPELFETDAQRRASSTKLRQQGTRYLSAAEAASPPETIEAFGKLGTAPLPGEVGRSNADFRAGLNVNKYTAAQEINVTQGDTLISLAKRYLGDARLWQDIARVNGLKAPFVDAMATTQLAGPSNPIPGILGVGDPILIPTFSRPPRSQPLLPVLGVKQDEGFEAQLLGTDYLLEEDDQGLFDWVIDTDGGSTDLKTVTGRDNLAQGLRTRVTIEKGSNILYRSLGLERVVGLGNIDVDRETARLRLSAAIEADPRVSTVRRIDFADSVADALVADVDVEVRGFSNAITARAIGVK